MFSVYCSNCSVKEEIFPYPMVSPGINLPKGWLGWRYGKVNEPEKQPHYLEVSHIFHCKECQEFYTEERAFENSAKITVQCDHPACLNEAPITNVFGTLDGYCTPPEGWIVVHHNKKRDQFVKRWVENLPEEDKKLRSKYEFDKMKTPMLSQQELSQFTRAYCPQHVKFSKEFLNA